MGTKQKCRKPRVAALGSGVRIGCYWQVLLAAEAALDLRAAALQLLALGAKAILELVLAATFVAPIVITLVATVVAAIVGGVVVASWALSDWSTHGWGTSRSLLTSWCWCTSRSTRNINPRRHHLANLNLLGAWFANRHTAGGLVRNTDLLAANNFLVGRARNAARLANWNAGRLRLGLVGRAALGHWHALVGAFRHGAGDLVGFEPRLVNRDREAETLATLVAAALIATTLVAAAITALVTATDRLAILFEGEFVLVLVFRNPFDLLPLFHHDCLGDHGNLHAMGLGDHFRVGLGLVGGDRDHLLFLDVLGLVGGVSLGLLDRLHHRASLFNHRRNELTDPSRGRGSYGSSRGRQHRGWHLSCRLRLLGNSRERHHCQERTRENHFTHAQHGRISIS